MYSETHSGFWVGKVIGDDGWVGRVIGRVGLVCNACVRLCNASTMVWPGEGGSLEKNILVVFQKWQKCPKFQKFHFENHFFLEIWSSDQSRQSGVLPGTIEVLIQMLRSAEGRPARSEKNCKVNPVSFYLFGNFGGSLFILKNNNWFSLTHFCFWNFDKHVILNMVMRSYMKYNTVINDYGHVERSKSGGSVFW